MVIISELAIFVTIVCMLNEVDAHKNESIKFQIFYINWSYKHFIYTIKIFTISVTNVVFLGRYSACNSIANFVIYYYKFKLMIINIDDILI